MILNMSSGIRYKNFAFISTAIIATTGALMYYYIKQKDDNVENALKTIPMPKGAYPYIGHLFTFDKMATLKFKEWHDDLGPVIQVKMGAYTWIIINDPYIAHDLFVKNGTVASNRPIDHGTSRYISNNKRGIPFADPNPKWKTYRSAARLTFGSLSAIDEHYLFIQNEGSILINTLIEACFPPSLSASVDKDEEQTNSLKTDGVDPFDSLLFYSANNVLQICFGTRIESTDNPLYQDIVALIEGTANYMTVGCGLIGFLPILSFRQELNDCKIFFQGLRDRLFPTLVDYASRSTQECMFQRLFRQRGKLDLEDEDLYQASGDMIVAGTETVTVTMTWIFAILLHYPDLRKRLGEEVDTFIRTYGRLPKFSERDQFPVMISVQKECMRYRPVLHMAVGRSLQRNVQCRSYVFPKNTPIFPFIYGHSHDSERYHNPDEFIFDRFINSTDKTMSSAAAGKIEDRDHFTFGWGRRVCPGSLFAETMIFNVMARMFAYCTMEPPLDGSLPDLSDYDGQGITVKPPPYKVRFIPRSDCLLP